MNKLTKLLYGILITVGVFFLAIKFGSYLNPPSNLFSSAFGGHSIMLLLSIISIIVFRKHVRFRVNFPKLKTIWRPIIFGFLASILTNLVLTSITNLLGYKIESLKILDQMSFLQVFLFVFLYASIAEELLFRGFLLNLLRPFRTIKFHVFKRNISLSVIISALLFGLAHFIVLVSGTSFIFAVRIFLFTSILGFIAGYYQEKHNNHCHAIIVHMSGNLLVTLVVTLVNLNPESF